MQTAMNRILSSRKMNKMRWMSLLTGLIQNRKESTLVQTVTYPPWWAVAEILIEPDDWLLIEYFISKDFKVIYLKPL